MTEIIIILFTRKNWKGFDKLFKNCDSYFVGLLFIYNVFC